METIYIFEKKKPKFDKVRLGIQESPAKLGKSLAAILGQTWTKHSHRFWKPELDFGKIKLK